MAILLFGCGEKAPAGKSSGSGGTERPSVGTGGEDSAASGGTGGTATAGESDAAPGSGGVTATDSGSSPAPEAGTADSGSEADAGDAGPPRPRPLAERVCPAGPFGDPLPPNRMATLIQGGFGFIEGPVWLEAQGLLLFSDMDFGASGSNGPPARIRRLTPPSSFDVLLEQGNTNGLALENDGTVLGCNHAVQDLMRLHPMTGAMNAVGASYDGGKSFNSPNDLTIRSDGTVYFTDPDWQLGPRTSETGITGVYRLPPRSREALLVSDALDKPNGITLSPDERTLYVGSTAAIVLAYPVNTDGSLAAPEVFASPGASDGMGIDCAGNLYVTAGGEVKVFASDGSMLGGITLAENPSNVAFGGADRRTLYITARTGLYAIVLNVPGLPY